MKNLIIAISILSVHFANSQQKELKDIKQYVVRIFHNEDQVGTGFAYKNHIVTNYHVIQNHILRLKQKDTTSKIYLLPAFDKARDSRGAYVSNGDTTRFVQFKKELKVPDKFISRNKLQNYAASIDLILLEQVEPLDHGTLLYFEKTAAAVVGAEIYCASYPLSSAHLNVSKGVSSGRSFEFSNVPVSKRPKFREQGYEFDPFVGYGDYVATSGSSGAPVFMLHKDTKELLLVGVNTATFNPNGANFQKFASRYKKKMDSLGNNFDESKDSHMEIIEKYMLFSSLSVNTLGVNKFIPTQTLWFLEERLKQP